MNLEPIRSDNVAFWESRYVENNTPWDLDQPAPPFVALLREQGKDFPRGSLAVVGAGLGHDAAFFGQHGFDVTGIDYVAEAVAKAQARYGKFAQFVQADLFQLPSELVGQFDYVVEHTCFCAILPAQREAYVQSILQLLKPSGILIGLFWAHSEYGGPPYKTDVDELQSLFSPYFNTLSLTLTPYSIERRQNEEFLAVFQRK